MILISTSAKPGVLQEEKWCTSSSLDLVSKERLLITVSLLFTIMIRPVFLKKEKETETDVLVSI